jgi:hypothetical protein
MKLGLITDIHEHVEHLQAALDCFRTSAVDRIVMIGDVIGMTLRVEETCRLLAEAQAIGVWGNHDFGLCVDPSTEMRARYSAVVIDYMTALRPRLEIEGCLFTHVEPWLDPENLADLWYFDGPPDEHGNLARIFDAAPHRLMFAGHYHGWLLATPDGICDWRGETAVRLSVGRYFVVVGALCEGRFATYDTATAELRPFNV